MREFCFLFSWIVPGAIFWVSERNASEIAKHWQSRGFQFKNVIYRERKQKARRVGAWAYAVVLFLLEKAFFSGIKGIDDAILCTGFAFFLAWLSYVLAGKVAFWTLDTNKFDGTDSNRVAIEQMERPIHELLAKGEHGHSVLESPEKNGMTDSEALYPHNEGGAQ